MNSLNSVHLENINTTGQQDTSICKNLPNNDCDSTSQILLKRIDAPSPDIPGFGSQVFKPFQKLIIYYHIGFFIRKLLKIVKPDQSFKPKHYLLINDKSSGNIKDFINYAGKSKSPAFQYPSLDEVDFMVRLRYQYKQFINASKQKIFLIFDQVPLIDPSYKLKIAWDLFLNCYRIYLIYVIPIMITFEQLIENYDSVIIISQMACMVDLLLRFITIYYDQGLPVTDRYQIVKYQYHLLNLIELLEICLLFSLAYFKFDFNSKFLLFEGWPKFLLLLYFIQIKNLLNFIGSWQQSILMGQLASSLIELFKLIGLLLIIQHIFSCIWLILGRLNQNLGYSNWISYFELDKISWGDLYIEAMYFTSVTMYTVGYGDLHPINIQEKIFAFLFVFVCTFQLSFSLNTIGEILTKMKNSNDIINKKLIFINQYMHNKKISNLLQFQVREYLNYYWYQEQTQQTKEQTEILGQLSDELRQQIAVESNGIVLKNCEFFYKNFSNDFLNELLKHLHFQSYQPSSTINIFNDDDYFIHIIESGQVDVYDKSYEKKYLIGSFRQGEHFGLNEFLNNKKNYQIEYKSSGFVSTLAISKNKFYQILQRYQNDFEIFWNLKMNNYQENKCAVCESKSHLPDQCRQVHYIADREKTIKQFNFFSTQERRRYRRHKRVRQLYHASTDQEVLKEAAEMVKVKNESMFFQKYHLIDDETTQYESQEVIKKNQMTSVQMLVKDLESKSYLDFLQRSQLKSEKEILDLKINFSQEIQTLRCLKDKLIHKELYSDVDLAQIEFLIKQLELKLNLEEAIEIDQQQDYQTYNTKANINVVLRKLIHPVKYIISQTSKSLDQYQLISGSIWLKYLTYPYDFINQYRQQPSRVMLPRKSMVVRQQERRFSSALLKKKQQNHRSIKRSIQVFPIQ